MRIVLILLALATPMNSTPTTIDVLHGLHRAACVETPEHEDCSMFKE